ncbi:hypothetical protein TNCV_4262711 [Trichonephila clavipes]|nr:hypothetical protein TNCV_4262711 [Trichonephila clavipes]
MRSRIKVAVDNIATQVLRQTKSQKSKQEAEKNEREAEKNKREAEIQLEKIKLSQIEKQLEWTRFITRGRCDHSDDT